MKNNIKYISIIVILLWISLFGIFDTLIHQFNNTYIRFLLYLILGLFAFILLENQKVDIV
jgi:predicted membrane channel-forming protein YqfA (hemolysin III family)